MTHMNNGIFGPLLPFKAGECYDTTQGTVVEGYRVTMPSGGSTVNEYKAVVACNGTSSITMSLDCLLRVFTLISIREMGLYL